MKFTIVTTTFFLIFSIHSFAQDSGGYLGPSTSYFSLTAGINAIDNSNGGRLPFDGGPLNLNTPFFIAAERKFQNHWSLALNFSTNQLNLINPARVEPYFSADVFANLYLDDLILKNENIGLCVGLGAGVHSLRGSGEEFSFNLNGGMRYWLTENIGLSLQAIGKIKDFKTGITQVDSHYQFNLGVSYRFLDKNQASAENDLEDNMMAATQTPPLQEPSENTPSPVEEQAAPRNTNITATSTDVAKDAYELDVIRKNAAEVLQTDKGGPKTYHVIIYSLREQYNVENTMRVLSEQGMKPQIIKKPEGDFNYISIANFNTKTEAYNYLNSKVDKEKYEKSWIYETERE